VPRDGVMRKTLHIVVALALLAGQWGLIVHELDLRAHAPGHQCEVCVAAAPCAGALAESGWPDLPTDFTQPEYTLSALRGGTTRIVLPPARAPPRLPV
jgi:hypothetical protein